jgi:hypothetical protein
MSEKQHSLSFLSNFNDQQQRFILYGVSATVGTLLSWWLYAKYFRARRGSSCSSSDDDSAKLAAKDLTRY